MGIRVNKNRLIFSLDGKKTQYVFGLDDNGLLRHIYWGSLIQDIDDFEFDPLFDISSNDSMFDIALEEYSAWGKLRYKEPCLKASFYDGTRDVVLKYEGYNISGEILTVFLKDEYYPLSVNLKYRMLEEVDLLERWAEVVNSGDRDITLEKINSAEFSLRGTGYNVTNVRGRWAAEGQRTKQRLDSGKLIFESRKGNTGHGHSPYFILDMDADEFSGEVYFGALRHSGNFKVTVEALSYDITRVLLGINDFDFAYSLKKDEMLSLPHVYSGYTKDGLSDMSNRMGRLARKYIMPVSFREKILPVLYNSWEASYFDIDCSSQIKLAERAAEIGVELFVVDDGWFGERNSDRAGLGDWYVNNQSFQRDLNLL